MRFINYVDFDSIVKASSSAIKNQSTVDGDRKKTVIP
jgi:hypothetical protein